MSEKIKVGIVGAGSSGCNIHGRLLLERKDKFEILSFCDLDKEKLKSVEKEYRVKTFDDIEKFLNQEEIELVIIATRPHSTHFPIAIKAMNSGKNIVVEKPVCIKTAECKKMIETGKEKNVFLFPHQNQRWNLGFMFFKEAIDKKVVGNLRFIEVKRYIRADYKGHIYEFMPHFVDCLLYLLDFDEPVEIMGVVENPEETWENLGYVYSTIRFKSGVVASISQLPDNTQKTPHFYWYAAGTEGSIWQENVYNKYDLVRKNARFTGKATSFIPEILETKLKGDEKQMSDFTGCFYDNIYDVMRKGKEQAVKPEEVLKQIFIIEKIIESARKKETIKL